MPNCLFFRVCIADSAPRDQGFRGLQRSEYRQPIPRFQKTDYVFDATHISDVAWTAEGERLHPKFIQRRPMEDEKSRIQVSKPRDENLPCPALSSSLFVEKRGYSIA